jgi:hypothetical protein
MADTLYKYNNVVGVEIAPYKQRYPTWGQFVTQLEYDGINTPYLGFFDENNAVVYEALGVSCGLNLYKWSFDLSIYVNLYNKCLHSYVYTNQQNIVNPDPIDILAESELINISADNSELLQIQYTNDEIFDNINYANYVNYAFVSAQFGHDVNFEETSTVYEKSNGQIIKLASMLKNKNVFQTDYIPIYEHEKINLAFMHDNVTVNGESYVKSSEYTMKPIDRYSLCQGGTTLSKSNYNYVNSNCL